MIRQEVWQEIQSRFRLGESKKAIARGLDLSVQTVRKALRAAQPGRYNRAKEPGGVLGDFEAFARERLPAVGYCAQSVYEELKERGYEGSYTTVKRFVRPFRGEASREATVRFETPPGKQAQVDWGQCWVEVAGRKMRVHLFVLTLGYSRRMFVKVCVDERLGTFLVCHEEAFDQLGGVPHEVLYDNPRTVVLSRDLEGRRIEWNRHFHDFARYYGFAARLCRPYRAQTKGKVESGVKYVKRFLWGKSFEAFTGLEEALSRWVAEVADQRIHGTTGRRPAQAFEEERGLLMAHQGKPRYRLQDRVVRRVARDCMVQFESNRYSVPLRFVGREVEVQRWNDRILVFFEDMLVVSHERCEGRWQRRVDPEHYHGILGHAELPSLATLHFDLGPLCGPEVEVRDLRFYERIAEGGAS